MPIELFGFTLGRSKQAAQKEQIVNQQKIAQPQDNDGSIVIDSVSGLGMHNQYNIDISGTFKTETDLIDKYRQMSNQPEVESAIDDIVSECIITDEKAPPVALDTEALPEIYTENVKVALNDHFSQVLDLLDFTRKGHDLFRRWYIDGRLAFQVIIDPKHPEEGIQKLELLDPKKLRKVKDIKREKNENGVEVISSVEEYYIYTVGSKVGFTSAESTIKLSADAVIYITSGLIDTDKNYTISYLHKAIKPLNLVRMIEDAVVIYRLARAPERRVFYIDTGNLPKTKAEQYIKSLMNNYKNKMIYDASTGEIKDDRRHLSMMEDFWLPRREGGRGTEITTLDGAQNLGEMTDVEYFLKKLYKSLNVPISRLDSQQGFSLGRASEISRDELKFSRFLSRLRNKFNDLFVQCLKVQLTLKNVIPQEEWEYIENKISFEYTQDNFFAELKNTEIMNERMNLLNNIQPYIGIFFSKTHVRKNVLKQDDVEILKLDNEIVEEQIKEMQRQAAIKEALKNNIPQQDSEDNKDIIADE